MKKLKFNPFSEAVPARNEHAVEGQIRERTAIDELAEGTVPSSALISPKYGGIVVEYAATPTEAALKLLNFATTHRAALDALLTQYGLLVEQLDAMPTDSFCIRRSDTGWALLVPEATKREHALLQIVQAFLAIARSPLAGALKAAGITPYRD